MVRITTDPKSHTNYGWDEDPATWKLLRAHPPLGALQWVEKKIGGRVKRVVALRGGLSSAVHRVDIHIDAAAGNSTQSFVLRRQVRAEVLDEEPDVVAREVAALQLALSLAVSTPQVIAADESGSAFGEPALLMTHLAGETVWRPTDFDQWLLGMASLLPEVHSISRVPNSTLQTFEPYFPEYSVPPLNSRYPSLWLKALEVAADYRGLGSGHLIHRDFHPGNLLWSGDSPPGLVDWMSACWGPGSMDVAHCRMNLMESHDLATADRFKTVHETVSGELFDPTADVIAAVDWLEDLQQREAGDLVSVEENLAKALAQIR